MKFVRSARLAELTLLFLFGAVAFAPAQTRRWLPQNALQLASALPGTTWMADGDPEQSYAFSADRYFQGKALQPVYSVIGRRMLIVHWSAGTNIRCLFNEECTAMTELGGERHTFVRLE